jgi:hypothetical protein
MIGQISPIAKKLRLLCSGFHIIYLLFTNLKLNLLSIRDFCSIKALKWQLIPNIFPEIKGKTVLIYVKQGLYDIAGLFHRYLRSRINSFSAVKK